MVGVHRISVLYSLVNSSGMQDVMKSRAEKKINVDRNIFLDISFMINYHIKLVIIYDSQYQLQVASYRLQVTHLFQSGRQVTSY